MARDWAIPRRGDEPEDFWSQSLCWGDRGLGGAGSTVRVRFRNSGGKAYARAEVHLAYAPPRPDGTRVTFAYADDAGDHTAEHAFAGTPGERPWAVPTGRGVRTKWVEFAPVAR